MTAMTTTSESSDTELLRQMQAGTAAAFAALYRRHQGPLYRFALLRCGSSSFRIRLRATPNRKCCSCPRSGS